MALGFAGGPVIKNLPTSVGDTETWVWSLGQEDPLKQEKANHSNTLAWKVSWTEEPGRLHTMGLQRVRLTRLHTDTYTHCGSIV